MFTSHGRQNLQNNYHRCFMTESERSIPDLASQSDLHGIDFFHNGDHI